MLSDKLIHIYMTIGHKIYPTTYVGSETLIDTIRIRIAQFFYARATAIDPSIWGDDDA